MKRKLGSGQDMSTVSVAKALEWTVVSYCSESITTLVVYQILQPFITHPTSTSIKTLNGINLSLKNGQMKFPLHQILRTWLYIVSVVGYILTVRWFGHGR